LTQWARTASTVG